MKLKINVILDTRIFEDEDLPQLERSTKEEKKAVK